MGKLLNILTHAHSGLRWLILVALVTAIAQALMNRNKGGQFEGFPKTIAKAASGLVHLQLLIGIVLYFISSKVFFGEGMMEQPYRFFTVEHVLGMFIAIVLITIGGAKAKRAKTGKQAFTHIALFYGIGLLLILLSIPWPFRADLGVTGWF